MLTNKRIIRKVFKYDYIKKLLIPRFIDNYNYYIRGVDLINQFKELYKTYKTTLKDCWPLFYWLINIVCINVYKLYLLYLVDIYSFTYLHF
jgi:hypothetical protein